MVTIIAATGAWAFEPFVVKDIRVEGLQRTEVGTVFSYLPVRIGETMTEEKATAAIRALFATGFYRDVRLEADKDVLVVIVEERPAIGTIDISGAKEFDKDTLKRALREYGLAESRIFDRSVLERAEQELKRQYLSKGLYGVKVVSTVTPLERNRVAVSLKVEEGDVAKIAAIHIVGNKVFPESTLLDQLRLSTPTWLSWYTKTDQYSREKLAGDLEALRSFYLNQGYLEFNIDSTQVEISPDKRDVYITANITEGERYRVSAVRFGGELLGREAEFRELMQLAPGEVFSGAKLSDSTKRLQQRLGELGYAFANVNAVPQPDREKREVEFTVLIDPGRRAYVRRINITGNSRTRDEVIRREFRQFEGAWYDAARIKLSRDRIDRMGYFRQVDIDTQPVPDAPDQVDVNLTVVEKPTGNFTIAAGFSSTEKIVLLGGISQQNFLGTGRSLDLQVNTSKIQRTIALSTTQPYVTPDGISQSFDLFTRTFNAQALNRGQYQIRTDGVGTRFGIPYTEVDRLFFGVSAERNTIELGAAPPQIYADYVNTFGSQSFALLTSLGWSRDSRDSGLAPTRGRLQSANIEATLPVGDLRYWRASYLNTTYWPATKDLTLAFNLDLGYARPFPGQVFPVFKNYYAGGIGSVRGYAPFSLGPFQLDPNDPRGRVPVGGQTKFIASTELILPIPGSANDRSFRWFMFVDAGNVFPADQFQFNELRYSTGLGLNWQSPIGPLKLSFGYPIARRPEDRVQRVQFQLGTGF